MQWINRLRRVLSAVAVLGSVFGSTLAHAEPPLQLEVSGKIGQFTDTAQHVYRFSQQDLLAMSATSVTTSTNWTPKGTFTGVALADVLKRVKASGTVLTVVALDGYAQDIPVADVAQYDPILAYELNGVRLSARQFGPLFIVYPRDSYPTELNKAVYEARFVWQASRIVVK